MRVPLEWRSATYTVGCPAIWVYTSFLPSAVTLVGSIQNPAQCVSCRGCSITFPVRRSCFEDQKLHVLVPMGSFSVTEKMDRPSGRLMRSEEHTSELQSQFHLVCR